MSDTVGVGVDLVDVARLAAALERRPRLAARLFTERERVDARGRPERLAARFAAKEATWKALGVGIGSTGFHDVEIVRAPGGEPGLRLSGRAAELAGRLGVGRWFVSLTHTATAAGAIVVGATS
jgi:holo-[acyl-carrier protein] synthase